MDPIFVTAGFLFGLIVGSFVNALAFRLNTSLSMNGRSQCTVCSTTIAWYDLVPVASFIVLRGKCRACRSPISFQYPLIEVVMGILFALTLWFFGITLTTLFLLIAHVLLVVILIYDMEHMIIPNVLVYPLIALGALFLFFHTGGLVVPSVSMVLAGVLPAGFFALVWLISRGQWMGFGDAKLALGLGWFLPLSLSVSMLLFSFWIGALMMLGVMGYQKIRSRGGLTLKSAVPFGPFIIAAFYLVLFTGIRVLMI